MSCGRFAVVIGWEESAISHPIRMAGPELLPLARRPNSCSVHIDLHSSSVILPTPISISPASPQHIHLAIHVHQVLQ